MTPTHKKAERRGWLKQLRSVAEIIGWVVMFYASAFLVGCALGVGMIVLQWGLSIYSA